MVDTGLIISAVIARGTSIPAFASSKFGRALGSSFPFNGCHTKIFQGHTVKQGKHDAIMLLAQSNLDSIADIISQAMQDGDIYPTEFHKELQEREKCCKVKADIRNRTKAKLKQIEKEQ